MSSLEGDFAKACDYITNNTSQLDEDLLLRLYGYYKQATVGKCNVPEPSVFEYRKRVMWKSWSKLNDLSKTEAMQLYVQTLNDAVPLTNLESNKTIGSGWISVSTMCKETVSSELPENAFDWVKEGDMKKLKHCSTIPVDLKDDQGLSLLHWAADRGHVDVLKYLIEDLKFDVNSRDDENQTPLHYAASCGHVEVCELLIKCGANKSAVDNDGKTPKDLAEIPILKELFI